MPDERVPEDAERTEQAGGDGAAPSARPFWSGTLTFGLVSIPVSLFPASRRASVSLRMLAPDGTPLSRRYYCPSDDVELDSEQIVRGYELEDGSYVVVSDEELDALDPKKSRDIDLRLFVPEAQIDPIYFERTYVLSAGSESTKAYRLLAAVMEQTGRAGIATFVMRENEYVIAIFAQGGILHAETLRFADEVRSPDDVGLPADLEPDAAAVKAFARVIEERAQPALDPEELRDTQTAALREHLEQKLRRGQDVIEAAEGAAPEGPAEVIDLMDVIKRSLHAAAAEPGGAETERPASPRARSHGPDRPARTRPSASDLERLSKQELLQRARELDVPGRSQMNKSELARELRKRAEGAA